MFLLIDNFDSFTFNLVQAFQQLGADPTVIRNDREEVLELATSGNWNASASPPDRATRKTQATASNSSPDCPRKFRCWACASATRRSATLPVRRWNGPSVSCTARPHGCSMTTPAYSPDCRTRLRSAATTRSLFRLTGRRQDRRDRAHQLGRSHGTPVQGPPMARGTVPPGIHPHARRPATPAKLSQHTRINHVFYHT